MSIQTLIDQFSTKANLSNFEKSLSRDAHKKLESMTLPHRKLENWKYTNLNKVLTEDLKVSTSKNKFSKLDLNNMETIYIVDGEVVENNINGVDISKRSDKVLEQTPIDQRDPIWNINMALIDKGHNITFKKDYVSKKPLALINIYTQNNKFENNTNTYLFEKFSNVDIVEFFVTEDDDLTCFINHSSHVVCESESNVNFIQYQKLNLKSSITKHLKAVVGKNASFKGFNITTGALVSRNNVIIDLNQEGAFCAAHGLYPIKEKQHSDTYSEIHHHMPHTESEQLYKGIMDDQSRGVFTGLVKIDKHAQLSNSTQLNKNILLSRKAHANSRPQLEIFADDVKCAHGSTTGQLSDDELFYFTARGISERKAKQMMAHGFIFEVILKIDNKEIQKYFFDELESYFND